MSEFSSRLRDLSAYVYGTTRLGDSSITLAERVKIAQAAIDAGLWLHTSHQYGDALSVLKDAFDQDRMRVPNMIFKIGWDSVEEIREQIQLQIEAVGIERMAIGQLCLGEKMGQELRGGGPGIEALNRLKEEGLVGRYVLEIWPWNAATPLEALRRGNAQGLVDGLIFYFNPLQRFVSNELWDLVQELDFPVIAMRTVSGGDVLRMQDAESGAPEYLRKRAAQVAPLFDRSGCSSWPEFCIRFVYGVPQVRTSVGATSRMENLNEFLRAASTTKPLPQDIQAELIGLQRDWYEQHDQHAEPWSM